MVKLKKSKRVQPVDGRDMGVQGRKDLPSLMFEESARTVLQDLVTKLPPAFTRDDLVREIHTYLDYSEKKIKLRGRPSLRVQAMEIGSAYFNPPYVGENWELLQQPDFKRWAEPLLTDGNLLILDQPMQLLRKRAIELGIVWSVAAPIVGRVADDLRPDHRTEGIRRGEFSEGVIGELKRIREARREFRTFEDLERIYPNFEVVRVLKHPPFDSEDRELLASPNQWERVVTYATGILSRYFKKSIHTIRQDRKQFGASIRVSTPRKRKNR